ncbi:hypothetical protein [Gordonia sp. SID5947]|nr:hypothetical protein [Gordonia sp. SID5947]
MALRRFWDDDAERIVWPMCAARRSDSGTTVMIDDLIIDRTMAAR